MNFNRFKITIIIIVILNALTGLLVVWSFTNEHLVVARFTFAILWVILIIVLIHYATRSNSSLKSFIESFRYLDTKRNNAGIGELDQLYNEIVGVIRKIETERETNRHYLKHTINHIGTGILSFNEAGEVELVNEATKRMFNLPFVRHISSFSQVSEELPGILTSLRPGQQKLLKLNIDNEIVGLSLRATEFRLFERKVRLFSIQNIKNELEEEELDAWQKLIRVLTHEIVNSVTPVNSLTNTLIKLFETGGLPKSLQEIDDKTIADALEGLHSIEKRNKGLMAFVQSYRSLTRIKQPVFSEFSVAGLFRNIYPLVRNEQDVKQIRFTQDPISDNLNLRADEKLVEQVLINLINNAVQALQKTENPEIKLSAQKSNKQVVISVSDNGHGIPKEIAGNIFIPFFTTREDGSGIGLSLSRQIMRLHEGSISVKSKPGETIFLLKFPNA